MDLFHNLNNLKNLSASVDFCKCSRVYSGRNVAVTEWPVVVSTCLVSSSLIDGGRFFNTLLSVMLSIAVLTNEG